MKQHLTATQSQQLALTPQLRQALAVLQMSATELETELADAVESNPLLEWAEDARPLELADINARNDPPEGPSEAAPGGDDNWSSDDTRDEWRESGEEWTRHGGGQVDDDDNPADRQIAEESLQDHLRWQLGLTALSNRDQELGLALIDAIDDDGYLRETLDSIIATLAPDIIAREDELLAVLHLLQQLDPVGCGGNSLGECLSIQLRRLPADTPGVALALRIAGEAIERLPKIGIEGVARQFGCTTADAEQAVALLRTLDPRPGSQIGGIAHDTYVVPDAVIWRQRGLWQAALAGHARPRVTINQEYAQMAGSTTGQDGQYLRGCLQEARWLLKNIEQRGETLLRVVNCLIREQSGFLEFGQQALRPLTLREVAIQLELHESTISRAIARKYVRTPRGTIALRDFFASGIDTGAGEASSTAIQSMIRDLVDAENPRKPLSDAALAEKLKQSGIPVARRTVAKYREALHIPASGQRVRLG
ncbi:RNA polymerase factor sigma-54 [Solilutibacter tolerans]|uniref:RNA polymerase sigma-54 factor n=1 Tax=Solilutibacter tolerans TaxID=1604334 RepID=A0A1N6NIP6_9GAMM|nr:RNA polymerase factor sigma-54 [Lysobacter tolerans]SIP91998.1 RNA polymerase, sigma 54 subunit, RpoN/SigL [Lysobacter tolerans]